VPSKSKENAKVLVKENKTKVVTRLTNVSSLLMDRYGHSSSFH